MPYFLVGSRLYGTTLGGGAHNYGTVFSVPVGGGRPTTLATFNKTNGAYPCGSLTLIGSKLYGTTEGDIYDTSAEGTVFSMPAPEPNNLIVAVNNSTEGTTNYPALFKHTLTEPLTITAHPKAGYVLGAWSATDVNGPVTIADPHLNPLTLPMTDNLSVTANFVASPFLTFWGAYYGTLSNGTNSYGNGLIRITMNTQGGFSGCVTLRGRRFPIHGTLDETGAFSKTYKTGWGVPDNEFSLSLSENLVTGIINGTVTENTVMASWTGQPIPTTYTTKSPVPIAGNYTIAFPAESPDPTPPPPQGAGYALIRVSVTGTISMLGRLPNGTVFSTSFPVNSAYTGEYDVPLYGYTGFLSGRLTFPTAQNPSATHDTESTPEWFRPADSNPKAPTNTPWLSGWDTVLTGFGSIYTAPAKGSFVLSNIPTGGALTVDVTDNGTSLFTSSETVTSVNAFKPAGGLSGNLNTSLANPTTTAALFTGGYVAGHLPAIPLNSAATKASTFAFSGVVLQKEGMILGYCIFRDATKTIQSMEIEISP